MKHIGLACGVFALCLAVGLLSVCSVRMAGAQTNEWLEQSVQHAQKQSYTQAAEALREAKHSWQGRQRLLGVFLHHEEVDEVIALFAQLEQYAAMQDQDDYLAACHELMARIEHVRQMELPTVENLM